MVVILTLFIVFASAILVLVVLVQKSKGGGLAAGFQSSNQVMGAPKTADFIEKMTWSLMGVIALCCIICTLSIKHSRNNVQGSAIEAQEQTAPALPENISDDAPLAPEANNE